MKNYKSCRIIFLSETEAKAMEKALSLQENSNKLNTTEKEAVSRIKNRIITTPFKNIESSLKNIPEHTCYILSFPKKSKKIF